MLNALALRRHDGLRSRVRIGFTLVELLVVIAIIGILVALLLPAIQAAREASRRAQCSNNLKQLGLALQNHHDIYKRLPPGGAQDQSPFGTAAGGEGSSWLVYILPYIEMGTMYDSFQFTGGSGWGTGAATNNYNLANNLLIPGYRCPSSPLPAFASGTGFNGTNPTLPTYAGVSGAINGLILGYAETRTSTGGGGAGCCTGGIVAAGGVLYPNSTTNYSAITDGTSNCLAAVEQGNFIITTDGVKNAWNAGSGDGWLIGVNATSSPPNFNNGGDARAFNTTTIRYAVNQNGTWPPGGNCGGMGVCGNVGNNIPVNSAHPGGAMVVLCDGSVRFVADATPAATLAQLATRDDGNPIGAY
ncbi:MAG: DUF1559 domain-containing protein [Planctomycetota bacterium]|nr:DUF1559 domain-containing protein [Planctomycetota bacterium]